MESRFVRGHLLKPGDIARTRFGSRCARPPYGDLRTPRASIPPGVVLSRKGEAWTWETDVRDVALPLYQGIMIQPFAPSARGWLSGTGLRATWEKTDFGDLVWNPQFLMKSVHFRAQDRVAWQRIGFRDVSRDTDVRSFQGVVLPDFPAGDSVSLLFGDTGSLHTGFSYGLLGILNSFVFDWQARQWGGGAHLKWWMLKEMAFPDAVSVEGSVVSLVARLTHLHPVYAPFAIRLFGGRAGGECALLAAERCRLRAIVDALAGSLYGLDTGDMRHVLRDVDHPAHVLRTGAGDLNVRGFWRVDRDKPPELRHTVLTLVAFRDLEEKIAGAGGDRDKGIGAFLSQNHGEGWMLPETLRLADYDLGHDDRAMEHQPVASRLGPRFYDWQLVQTAEERKQETHLHARNLLGAAAYGERLADRIAEDAAVDDEKGDFDLLIRELASHLQDEHTRRLLGDEGVAALVAELWPRAGPQRAQWPTFLRLLRSAGQLATADCLRVLDRLVARELITEPEHHRWSAIGQSARDPSADLLAAEPRHEFQLRPQGDPRKLFDR